MNNNFELGIGKNQFVCFLFELVLNVLNSDYMHFIGSNKNMSVRVLLNDYVIFTQIFVLELLYVTKTPFTYVKYQCDTDYWHYGMKRVNEDSLTRG